MSRSLGRNSDQYDKKGDERGIEGCSPYGWKELPVAIEDEGKGIDDLVANKDVPWVDCATGVRSKSVLSLGAYKSGWDRAQHPTPALPTAKATLAEVKILPAQANQPVKYDAKLAYLLGASSFAQKYCPPALG